MMIAAADADAFFFDAAADASAIDAAFADASAASFISLRLRHRCLMLAAALRHADAALPDARLHDAAAMRHGAPRTMLS